MMKLTGLSLLTTALVAVSIPALADDNEIDIHSSSPSGVSGDYRGDDSAVDVNTSEDDVTADVSSDDRAGMQGYDNDVDVHQSAGTVEDERMTSRTDMNKLDTGLETEKVAIRPQIGTVLLDRGDGKDARAVGGLTLDWNAVSTFTDNEAFGRAFIGPSIGAFYSRLGDTTTGFFGQNSDVTNAPAASLLVLPANLKLGYLLTDKLRVSAHGGGNALYRSSPSLAFFGTGNANDNWTFQPNAGADLEWGIGKNVSLLLRPDWTFTPGNDLFTGTIGLGIGIG